MCQLFLFPGIKQTIFLSTYKTVFIRGVWIKDIAGQTFLTLLCQVVTVLWGDGMKSICAIVFRLKRSWYGKDLLADCFFSLYWSYNLVNPDYLVTLICSSSFLACSLYYIMVHQLSLLRPGLSKPVVVKAHLKIRLQLITTFITMNCSQ